MKAQKPEESDTGILGITQQIEKHDLILQKKNIMAIKDFSNFMMRLFETRKIYIIQ